MINNLIKNDNLSRKDDYLRLCSVDGCNKKHEAKGYCKSHYRSFHKYGDPLQIEKNKRLDKRPYKSNGIPKTPYEDNHKNINGVEYKLCKRCEEFKPMNEEFFYKKKTNLTDGFDTYCKECAKEKAYEWILNNRKQFKKNRSKYLKGEKYRAFLERNEDYYKNYRKEYVKNNKEKFKGYRENRLLHKNHDISSEELNELYAYCNSSCMYCGISEKEHLEKHKQKLHRDHAINDGSDGIDNCILACRSCNTSKSDKDWFEWYNENNHRYDKDRYEAIEDWLNMFKQGDFSDFI